MFSADLPNVNRSAVFVAVYPAASGWSVIFQFLEGTVQKGHNRQLTLEPDRLARQNSLPS